MNIILKLILLIACCIPYEASANVFYVEQQLLRDKQRYTQRINYLYNKGLWNFMTPDEQKALKGTVFRFPTRDKSPIAISSSTWDGTPTVRVPLSSLKFIEDLSIAYAWRYFNQYSLEPIDEYLAILRHREPKNPSNPKTLQPLTALGVPEKIWETDKRIDDLSLRFRNSAWAFIIAHELGHLRLGHTLSSASPSEIQRQEVAADKFAVDLLNRSKTIPMGMILWLQATAGFLPNRSDFSTEVKYYQWIRDEATHPVNGRRMKNLASELIGQASRESDPDRASVLKFIASRLLAIGSTVEDPEMQQLLKRCARSRRLEDLKRKVDKSCL